MTLTRPVFDAARGRSCPRNLEELLAVMDSPCAGDGRALGLAIEPVEEFWDGILPFVWQAALRAGDEIPELALLDAPGTVILTQRQCLAILASAFLCRFEDRPSDNCLSGPRLPSINFDEMYAGNRLATAQAAKIRMILEYFRAMRRRSLAGDALSRPVLIRRHRVEARAAADWEACDEPLLPPVMHALGESIDEVDTMLRVDFANRIIGGGALAQGCVQEEITFALCPELIVTRLICPVMRPDEAIAVSGAEQFSRAAGYASSLSFGGPCHDERPLRPDGMLDAHVVAIDAVDYRLGGIEEQFGAGHVLRELNKARAGATVPGTPVEVATGNWGCGAFGGDPELKCLIQWVATSRAGKIMHYFPWDNAKVHGRFPEVAAAITARGVSTGRLARVLLGGSPRSGVVLDGLIRYIS